MSGSGSGFDREVKGKFIPSGGEATGGWDDAQPPRFWQSDSGGAGDWAENRSHGDEATPQPQDAGPRQDVRLDALPLGMRPGERPQSGQAGRLMDAVEAARIYRQANPGTLSSGAGASDAAAPASGPSQDALADGTPPADGIHLAKAPLVRGVLQLEPRYCAQDASDLLTSEYVLARAAARKG